MKSCPNCGCPCEEEETVCMLCHSPLNQDALRKKARTVTVISDDSTNRVSQKSTDEKLTESTVVRHQKTAGSYADRKGKVSERKRKKRNAVIFSASIMLLAIVLIVVLVPLVLKEFNDSSTQQISLVPNSPDTFWMDDSTQFMTEISSKDIAITNLESDVHIISTQEPIVEYSSNFSEDRAWIQFRFEKGGVAHFGCINKKGELLFYLDGINLGNCASPGRVLTPGTNFSDGYAFAFAHDKMYVIDKSGEILSEYTEQSKENDVPRVFAYADGYVWMQQYISGFDKAYYKYQLYAPDGGFVTEFIYNGTKELTNLKYCGSGVWRYRDFETERNRYYSIASNCWIDFFEKCWVYSSFYNQEGLIGVDYWSDSNYVKLYVMDSKGNIRIIEHELIGYYDYGMINDGLLTISGDSISSNKKYFSVCNTETGVVTKLDGRYAEYLRGIPSDAYTDGVIPLIIEGQDGKEYLIFFDKLLNPISTPLACRGYHYSDGLMIAETYGTTQGLYDYCVIDSAGKVCFSVGEKGYSQITSFSDGVARALPNTSSKWREIVHTVGKDVFSDILQGNWVYIDTNGNQLFDSINVSTAKAIQLS